MNNELLLKHIKNYIKKHKDNKEFYEKDLLERQERIAFYQSFNTNKLLKMTIDDLYQFFSKLWAMLIWGNKKYVVDKLIEECGLETIKTEFNKLLWGNEAIAIRWEHFRKTIKGMGPAMISEILCHVHPDEFIIWNRRAFVGLKYLGFTDLPRYNYQVTGQKYFELCQKFEIIKNELIKAGISKATFLTVDYFIWDELQVESNLSQVYTKNDNPIKDEIKSDEIDNDTSDFIHNEIRDKLADIGKWLGFITQTETKVADGSKVDAIWEATIGNMGRVIYVFEVQTKGSIDSLIINLLKSLKNPAVQGVVAVSDSMQLEKIRKHAHDLGELGNKLKYWDYKEVLTNYEALLSVNESINKLNLVPQGFI